MQHPTIEKTTIEKTANNLSRTGSIKIQTINIRMKYVLPLALLASGSSLVRADPRPIGDNDWFMLASQAGSGGPCQENNENGENAFCARTEDNQPGMTGTNVVMGTECPWDNMSGWRLWTAPDNDGFLLMLGDENGYSESPKALCMQAG